MAGFLFFQYNNHMDQYTPPSITQQVTVLLPPATKLMGDSFRYYRDHWQTVVGIILVPFAIGMAEIVLFLTGIFSPLLFFLLGVGASIASILSWIALVYALSDPTLGTTSAYKKSISAFFSYAFVSALVMFSGLGGLVLLVIPGVIVSILLSLSLYVFVAENKKGISALTGSWHYAAGNIGALLWRFLFLFLVIILLTIPISIFTAGSLFVDIFQGRMPIGGNFQTPSILVGNILGSLINSFIILPISIIYTYGIYLSLKRFTQIPASPEREQKLRRYVIALSIIGVIGLILFVALFALAFLYFASYGNFSPSFLRYMF